jgi:hypothetical protein
MFSSVVCRASTLSGNREKLGNQAKFIPARETLMNFITIQYYREKLMIFFSIIKIFTFGGHFASAALSADI